MQRAFSLDIVSLGQFLVPQQLQVASRCGARRVTFTTIGKFGIFDCLSYLSGVGINEHRRQKSTYIDDDIYCENNCSVHATNVQIDMEHGSGDAQAVITSAPSSEVVYLLEMEYTTD